MILRSKLNRFYGALLVLALLHIGSVSWAQPIPKDSPAFKRYFIGTSSFMLFNLSNEKSPQFYQFNAGMWLTDRDALSAEVKTWRYYAPIGVPYGELYNKESEEYPGSVVAVGGGLAYQHFWWRGLYNAIHADAFHLSYKAPDGSKIANGFQLFCTARIGYHFAFWQNRLFIEPGVAATFWPIQTGMPDSFKEKERRHPNYFFVEPGLHIGYKFK